MTAPVRGATPADAHGVYRVWQALRKYNSEKDSRIMPLPVSETEFAIAFRDILARPTSAAFVAEANGRIVGFISGGLELNPDRLPEQHATVGYLYVDPDERRQGMGRELLRAFGDWASQQEGVSHVEMTVLADDEAASAFWKANGFTPFIERLWVPLETLAGEQ